MWKATGEGRWHQQALAHIEQIWRGWQTDEANHGPLWTQALPGSRPVRYLGAGRGYVGNVHSLLTTAKLLDAMRREQLHARSTPAARTRCKPGRVAMKPAR